MILVADAGPILHLFWVDALSWALPQQQIYVADAVWREIERHAPETLQDGRLQRVTAAAIRDDVAAWNLDAGEEETLSYALEQGASESVLVLSDERRAREACNALSLSVTGSVGLIVEAYREQAITVEVAEDALLGLPGRGRLHVSRRIIEAAVAALQTGGR